VLLFIVAYHIMYVLQPCVSARRLYMLLLVLNTGYLMSDVLHYLLMTA